MFKPKPLKPVLYEFVFWLLAAQKGLFNATLRRIHLLRASYVFISRRVRLLAGLFVLSLMVWFPLQRATPVNAATPTLNFQARLENSTGGIAPDGDYNVEFKLYNVTTGGTALWTESRKQDGGPDNRVHIANGYLTVNLGSVTNFPGTINWDDDLYLTMNIGGTSTGAPTWDGEMSPRLKLTSVPYAFQAQSAGQLQVDQGTYAGDLTFGTLTGGNQSFVLPDQGAAGTYNLLTTNQANTNYIQNQNAAVQSSSSFWISGTGRADTSLQSQLFQGGDATAASTNSANITLRSGNATGATSNSGNVIIDVGTATGTAGTISIGVANTTGITIGHAGAATTIDGGLTLTNGGNVAFQKASSDVTTTGNVNNLSVTGALVRFNGASQQTLTGIAGGVDGRILTIFNVASSNLIINNNDTTNSSAGNTIATGSGSAVSIPSGGSLTLMYDSTSSIWRVIGVAASAGVGGPSIQNTTVVQDQANFYIRSNGDTTTGVLEGSNGQTADILRINTFNGSTSTTVAKFDASGNLQVAATVDTVTAAALGIGITNATNITIGHNAGTFAVDGTNFDLATTGRITLQGGVSGGDILTQGTNALSIDTGGAAALSLGVTNATSVYISRSGVTTTINGALTVTEAATFNGTAQFNQNVTVAAGKTLRIVGGNTASHASAPTSAGQLYFDTDTNQLLTSIYNTDTSTYQWKAAGQDAVLVAANNSSVADKQAADYVADGTGDQQEINWALTKASGGRVYLFPGKYVASGTILIPNNTVLSGAGRGTLIELADLDATDNLIENSDTVTGTGVRIQDLRIDGRSDLNTAGTQHGITFNGMGGGSGATARQGGAINGVVVNNFRNYGIFLTSSPNNTITNNQAMGNTGGGIGLDAGSHNTTITGNLAQGGAYGIVIGSLGNTITGNTVQGQTNTGVYLIAGQNNAIVGNAITGNSALGIALTVNSSNNTITGNKLYDNGGSTTNNSIYVSGSDSNSITGNNFSDSSATATNYAINIADSTSDTNYLANNALGGSSVNDAGTGTVYSGQSNGTSYLIRPGDDFTITGNAASTISTTSGNLTLQGGSGTVSLGTSTILTASGALNLTSGGATALGLDTGGGAAINIGATNATSIVIGRSGVTTEIQGNTKITLNATTGTGLVCQNTGTGVLSVCDSSYVAPTAGNFIQNQNSSDQTGNFRISGTGRANTSLLTPILDLITAGTLSLGPTTATAISIGHAGITSTVQGALTVNQLFTGAAGATVSGGAISLSGNAASSFTTSSGALTLTSATAATWSTNAGNLTLQAGSGTVSLGTSTILTASGALSLTSGGANTLSVDAGGAAGVSIGTTNANAVTISKSGVTTTIQGALTVTEAATFNGTAQFNQNVTVATGKTLTLTGGTTLTRNALPTTEGSLFYDTDTHQLMVYNGTKWIAESRDVYLVAANNSSGADKAAADYVADGTGDQVEINAALNRADPASVISGARKSGKVYLFAGTYVIGTSVSIPNNTTLAGAGSGTVIELADLDTGVNAIVNSDTTTGTGVTIQKLKLDGRSDLNTAGTQHGIYLAGIGASNSAGATVNEVQVTRFRSKGIFLDGTNNSSIHGSHISNTTDGVYIYASFNNTVTSNTLVANGSSGVGLESATNNVIDGNAMNANSYGVFAYSASSNIVSDNSIISNSVHGVELNGASNTNTLSGNSFQNNGGATTNNAIYIDGSDANSIIANTIADSSATTNNYALNISNNTSDANYLAGNTLSGGGINDAGTGTILASNILAGGSITGTDATRVYNGQADTAGNYQIQPTGTIELLKNTNLTGNLAVTGTGSFTGGSVTIATSTSTDDRIITSVTAGGGTRFDGTITNADLTAARTWTLPNASGTLCVQQSSTTTTNCDLSGSFIQNQNASAQTTANFWISGTGRASTSFLSPLFDVASAATLSIGTGNANAISISKSGVTTTVNGALTVAQLLTGQLGATISGAAINLNASSNFATNINTGTSTGAVSIGNSAAGAISLQSGSTVSLISGTTLSLLSTGANNINITPGGGSNTGVLLKPTTDSTAAFQIQKAGSTDAILTADTTNGQTILGTPGSLAGNLVFANSGNTNKITLTAPSTTAASYTLVLPENTPTTGLCLTTSNTNASQLVFASCFQQVSNAPISHAAGWSANGTNITTINVAPTGPGDLLILSLGFQNNQTVTNVTGGGVTSWQPITSGHSGTGSLKSVEMWRGVVTSTGSSTVTLTFSGSAGTTDIPDDEYTMNSAYGTWSVDTSSTLFNSASTTVTYPSLLPQSNNELYSGYGLLGGTPGLPATCTGTFTCRTTTGGMIAYSTTSTSGVPIQPTPSQTTSSSSYTIGATIIAFANNNVIVNSTTGQTGNFNVTAATAGTVTGVLQAASSGSADIFDLKNGSGTAVATFGNTGAVLFKNSTDSTTAFQVQNASGTSIFNVDTTNAKIGTRNETAASTNSAVLTVKSGDTTGSTSNTGNVVIGSGNASSGNSGNITIDTGSASGTKGGITIGGTNAQAITITANAASTWKTTSGDLNIQGAGNLSLNTAGSGAVNIGTTNTGSIALGSTGATTGITLQSGSASGNGVNVQSSSATAFRVQNSGASFTLLTADLSAKRLTVGATATPNGSTSANGDLMVVGNSEFQGLLYIGNSSTNAVYTSSAGGPLRFKGTARNNVTVRLVPEYAGAVMTGDGSSNAGTMTSDFCSGSSYLGVPASSNPCGATEEHNYYSWTTSQASAQDYDIYVRWNVPSNYDSADGLPTVTFYGWRTNTTNDSLTMSVISGATTCGTATAVGGSNGAWSQQTYNNTGGSCTITPGTTVLTLRLHMTANTSDFVRAGEIGITYNTLF